MAAPTDITELITSIPKVAPDNLDAISLLPMHPEVRQTLLANQYALMFCYGREMSTKLMPETINIVGQWIQRDLHPGLGVRNDAGQITWNQKWAPLLAHFPNDKYTHAVIVDQVSLTNKRSFSAYNVDKAVLISVTESQADAIKTHLIKVDGIDRPITALYCARLSTSTKRIGYKELIIVVPENITEMTYDHVGDTVGKSRIIPCGFTPKKIEYPEAILHLEPIEWMKTMYMGSLTLTMRLILAPSAPAHYKLLAALYALFPELAAVYSKELILVPLDGHAFNSSIDAEMTRVHDMPEEKVYQVILGYVIARAQPQLAQINSRLSSFAAATFQTPYAITQPIYARFKIAKGALNRYELVALGMTLSRNLSGVYDATARDGNFITGTAHVARYSVDSKNGEALNQLQMIYRNKNKSGIAIAAAHMDIMKASGLMLTPWFKKAVENMEKFADEIAHTPFAGLVYEIDTLKTTAMNAPAIYYAVQAMKALPGSQNQSMQYYDTSGLEKKLGRGICQSIQDVVMLEVKDQSMFAAAKPYGDVDKASMDKKRAGLIKPKLGRNFPNCSGSMQDSQLNDKKKLRAVVARLMPEFKNKIDDCVTALNNSVVWGIITRVTAEEFKQKFNRLKGTLQEVKGRIDDESSDLDYLSTNAICDQGAAAVQDVVNSTYDLIDKITKQQFGSGQPGPSTRPMDE